MEESEKLVALKKAYADMILNAAKEASRRVVASERKALRFQHDLAAAKDEAFRMLLHLKQMIDAKATEAKISSSSQQAKIDELEAQLQEAEGVIVDLRAELKLAHNKLEKLKNPLNGKITGSEMSEVCHQDENHSSDILSSDSRLQTLTTSDTNNTLHDQKHLENTYLNEEQVAHPSVSQFGNHNPHVTELHNCTERIPAAGKLPPNTESDENSFRKCESCNDHGKFTLCRPLTRMDYIRKEVQKRVVQTSGRRIRFLKPKAKYRSCSSQLMKPHHRPSFFSSCKRNSEKAVAENTTSPCHESNLNMVNVPVVYSDSEGLKPSKEGIIDVSILSSDPKDAEAFEEPKIASRPDNNRQIKYTFQRKRKREASISTEKSTVKRKVEEKHNG